MIWRRAVMVLLALCTLSCMRPAPELQLPRAGHLDPALWEGFRTRFITDGRVIDVDNGGITHSEGQGYGMLLAVAADDRHSFDALFAWTKRTLARPDGLFAWRFGPCQQGAGDCVTDSNNASDGDLLIAWALLRAADRWGAEPYRQEAAGIAQALAAHQVVRRHGRLVLLPGVHGFDATEPGGVVTVNPSYWVFPALEQLAVAFAEGPWRQLAESGRNLLGEARFGAAKLAPDWLDISAGGLAPSARFEPRYGYNAVRVPLHLAWSVHSDPSLLAPYLRWWAEFGERPPPAWVDLVDGRVAEYAWSTGMAAVSQVARARVTHNVPPAATLPVPAADDGYYAWSLLLLSHLALAEMRQ